ncbi:MAG TPA: peptidylprolyl isomerase [Telluria sp.]|nr:peptidylprolyl isomerase [Telluria sp.]
MMLKPARLLALSALVAVPAFAQNIATVNGKGIPASKVDQIVKQEVAQGKAADTPQLRAQIKNALIAREVMVQEADKQGYGNKPEVKAAMDNARQSIVINALLADWVKKNPVSDAEIKAEYDKFKATMGDKEYRARHILVPTEKEAVDLIAKIKGGAKFEDLAKAHSKDGSAANGGDLDFASPANYMPEFSNAMVALKKGEVTTAPVKTQYGYHIIKLEDTRPAKLPALEEVKPQVAQSIQQRRLAEYRETLVKKATVK